MSDPHQTQCGLHAGGRKLAAAGLLIWGAVALTPQAYAQTPQLTEFAEAVNREPVTLEQALRASETKGKPISAQYEIKDDKMRITVYTMNMNEFTEVTVAADTGSIVSAETITDADDLEKAEAQKKVMEQASTALLSAVETAIGQNAGARAARAVPSIKAGQPLATILLLKGSEVIVSFQKLN